MALQSRQGLPSRDLMALLRGSGCAGNVDGHHGENQDSPAPACAQAWGRELGLTLSLEGYNSNLPALQLPSACCLSSGL